MNLINQLLRSLGIEPGTPTPNQLGGPTRQKRWRLQGKGYTRANKDQSKKRRKMAQASRKINWGKKRKT